MKKIFILYFIFALFMPISCVANIPAVSALEISESYIRADYDEFDAMVEVRSNAPYAVDLESDWATVSSIARNGGFDAVTIHCDMNTEQTPRYAEAIVNTSHASRRIYIVQDGCKIDSEADGESDSGVENEAPNDSSSKTDNETNSEADNDNDAINEAIGKSLMLHLGNPGTLYKMCRNYFDGVNTDQEYGEEIWGDITSVTLTGIIDARDFSTLKWNFRNLKDVDLSGVKIAAYGGEYGTNEGYYDGGIYSVYNANEIPIGAFFYWSSNVIRNFPSNLFDEGMASLLSIKLPEGVNVIRRNAFARAYNLQEINVPEGVEVIEMVAFRYCTSIEELYLPSTLKDVGWLAFTDMYALKEVHIKAKNAPSENQSFGNYPDSDNRGYVVVGDVNYSEKTNAVLYVPSGCKANYKGWEKYFVKIVEE